jgi:hypothetical protein
MATTSNPKVIVRELEVFSSNEIRKLILDIVDTLIETTPVDTGWARANWVPSIGQSVEGPFGDDQDVGTAEFAQSAGVAEMLGYDINKGPAFVTNSVPYIERLNQGSSTQAPSGFVETAIDSALARAGR